MIKSDFINQVQIEVAKTSTKSKFHKGMVYEQGFSDGALTIIEAIKKILGDNSLVIVDRATIADLEWLQESDQGDS